MSATLWQVARRPQWIGGLVLALAIAAGFAALGQWQLSRSVEGGAATPEQTETSVPLTSIAVPQQPMPSATIGQLATVTVARFVAGDYVVLSDRSNLAEPGYWVVGHAVLADGASLAVALGWTSGADAAASAIRTFEAAPPTGEFSGRYLPSESPQQSDFEAGRHSALAVPELVNLWADAPKGVYSGYLVLSNPVAGLDLIDAPPPNNDISLNLLNVFYAVEWVIFAGFAIFLWYRLVKDVWEEEAARDA
ncbi:MAG: SURF1 family cytochrome oxidase biogenesis protein [Rhodoglobus sp.]